MPEPASLAETLSRQIAASGPISVADYMRRANEAYYASGDPLGTDGDFITAPEISQMFGEMIGLWLADLWIRAQKPDACHYVELGPGRGTLAADALRAADGFGLAPPVAFVETSALLRERQLQAVPRATFHMAIDSLPRTGPLLIVANEFFDALPVRQMIKTEAGWRERVVTSDGMGGFTAIPGDRAVDALVPADVRAAPIGSLFEHSADAATIAFDLAKRIEAQGGALLAVDYGYDRLGVGETLQAVRDHRKASVFSEPGKADLTAHVSFHELANIGRAANLEVLGPVGQGSWLRALGIDARAQALSAKAPDKAIAIEAARDRLTAPDKMGALFRVLAIAAPGWPRPEGFGPA